MKVSTMALIALAILVVVCNTCLASDRTDKTDRYSSSSRAETNSFAADAWQESVDVVRVLWKDCSKTVFNGNDTGVKQEHFSLLIKCAKRKTLKALDRTLNSDVISLGPGIKLVKYEVANDKVKDNRNATLRAMNDAIYENGDWRFLVLERMANVFNTHVLKLDMQDLEKKSDTVESRHRRRHHMMQMMMFGITSMGMVLVPMGFQFLAVLGGKALLLAKLALLLSSIQGLKKIATSPLNYGLYQVDSHLEKRGHGQSEWKSTYNKIEEPEEISQEKIKYRYDSESRLWKPEMSRKSNKKRSLYGQNVYAVYPVSPHESSSYSQAKLPQTLYTSSGGGADVYNHGPSTDIHAEYTIDLPVKRL